MKYPLIGSLTPFRRALLRWYDKHRRDLPWRAPLGQTPPAYHVLLSEAMLQQTQVATVIPYFLRFIERFPTLEALADAPQQEVLRLWQGLGYYSRARNLQAAARAIVERHGGEVPRDPEALLELPGVGRYTAGAIASLAYDVAAPILDGNVIRVLCRLDAIDADPREKAIHDGLWNRAREVLPRSRAGDFNSALMELGATVCTPRNPQCLTCPVRGHCSAAEMNVQEKLPRPKQARSTPLLKRVVLCLHHRERYLIEQRPARGRWAGMWQFISREPSGPVPALARQFAQPVGKARKVGTIRHALTHRRYEFEVWEMGVAECNGGGTWVTLSELDQFPLPVPHLRIARLLRTGPAAG